MKSKAVPEWNGTAESPRSFVAPPITVSTRKAWRSEYVRRLAITDFAAVSLAVGSAQLIRFNGSGAPPLAWDQPYRIGYTVVSGALAMGWFAILGSAGSRAPQLVGSGVEEFRRLMSATMHLFGVLALMSLALEIKFARGYLAIAFPAGVLAVIGGRLWWRHQLARERRRGRHRSAVLVVGTADAAAAMTAAFAADPGAGYDVVGACVPGGQSGDAPLAFAGGTVAVVGDDSAVLRAVLHTHADTVAIGPTRHLGPTELRRLAWELDALGVEFMLAPGAIDIAISRLTNRQVAGMPMMHIAEPQYERARSVSKTAFDIGFATVCLLLLLPVLLVIAIAVKTTSRGPVFYLSERIGRYGLPFRMIKFRSMYDDADRYAEALIAQQGGNPVFFKMKVDPRVTPVGRFLRKYSLDELPQFLNVLRGDMSVVGPRPQVRREVDTYDHMMRRRLLVKPGLTGLWQVSGRSDLPLEDAVRLDLSYVENVSMRMDLRLIARTVGVVARGEGAY
ncbi:polyprenyl glycosylphosphotransferase [Nocardia sputorum]|uniref:Polyprenyl glycosylphosphotransferase n=1 Tax=Nocardia sputorum TaxID=2984338 RepID=A0ABM8D7P0_9NOCA|nr:polyprenyl glycosylphosphotransferase [Nocardia sputorum]BDU03477.1 polyprenyl glycosylphosphotransferase [Nocardia sputorum]